MMMLIKVSIIFCFSCVLALESEPDAPIVPPTLTGDIFRSFGHFKHRGADGIDKFINKIKHRTDGEQTVPGNVLRAMGDFKLGLGDAADNVVDSVRTNLHKGTSAVGNIFGDLFHKKHQGDKHSSHLDIPNSSTNSPPEFPSVSIDISSSADFTHTNTMYPYPDIKIPASTRFIFIHDGKTKDLTVEEIIYAGRYLDEARKKAFSN